MALLLRDRFDRVAASLGSDWNERPAQTVSGQSIGTCNMSCDGDFARIDTTPTFHIATAVASDGSTEHYVECWCFAKASNNAGLVLRFQDAANMYFLFPDPAGSPTVRIHRRRAGTQTLNVATGGTVVANDWNLISIIMTGNRIRLWLNGTYNTALEGPVIDFTDGTPVTGAGSTGIMSSGNNATGASGPQWNDFRLNTSDQRGETIYVVSSGTNGYGDGEVDAPMPGLAHGLNCCGTLAGTRVKCADAGPFTNSASTLRYEIGHAGKFDVPGFVFPTYSDDTGEVLTEGTPNLIIEGVDGLSRTVLRETQGTVPFFRLRTGARGVVFRGLNFEATSVLRAVHQESSLTSDRSYSIDKCLITPGPTGGVAPFIVSAACTAVRCLFSYAAVGTVNLGDDIFSFIANASVRSSLFRMFLVKGDCNHPVNYTQTMPTWQSGDVHDCDHITFHAPDRASALRSVVALLQPNLIAAGSRLTVQNSISFIEGPEQVTSQGYGVYFGNTNVPAGTMEEHHNGFDGLALDACDAPAGNASTNHVGTTCNIAAADAAKDPQFNAPTNFFKWRHTAGAGLNGEGTFAALDVPDLRVNNTVHYKDQADDATVLQILDKGALQDYALPPEGSPAGSDVIVAEPIYCVGVTFDPGGNQETDLSGLLQLARPIRLEKDVLLRRYRANDVDLEFADVDGLFLEENPLSFLLDPVTGEPDWFNKRVVVIAQFGNSELVRFDGFLLNVSSQRGVGRMQLANRFQALTDRPVRANSFGRLVSTTRDPGIGPAVDASVANAPATGTFLGTLMSLNGPPAQVYTVTFVDGGAGSQFKISGSVTGFEGSGTLGVAGSWQSVTGDLEIDPSVGGNFTVPAAPERGQTCTFEVLWRPSSGQTIIQAILQFLTDSLGAGLTTDDLDLTTFTVLQGTVADQVLPSIAIPAVPRLAAAEGNVLDAIQVFALHAGTVLFETSQAKLGLSSFMPRIVTEIPILCSSSDLMEAGTDHLQIYNEFMLQLQFDERTEKYTDGEPWPPVGENDSQVKYERRLPAPNALAFRGYDASNGPWTKAIARALYFRYKDPARIYTVTAKIERLNAELNQVYRIESEGPTFVVATTDPASIAKQITGPLTVDMQLIKDELVTDGQCPSFLQLDNPAMRLDDPCWRLF
jgi:hypothetical protein